MRRVLPLMLAILLMTACSSTEQKRAGSRTGGSPDSAANDLTGAPAPDASPGAAAAAAKSAGGTRKASAKGGSAAGGAAGAAGAAGALGRGITDSTIKLGFVAQSGADEFYKSFGINVSFGDDKQMIGALLDDLNKRGGILGRKVEPVFGPVSVPSADQKGDAARLCALFTEDEKVFAVLNYYWVSWPDYFSCLSAKKTLHLSAAATTGDDQFMQELAPYYQLPSMKADNRMWRTAIPALQRNNFFPKGAKVALVVADMPMYDRVVTKVVKPLMAGIGAPIQSEFKAAFTYADAEMGSLQSQMAQAVLKFKTEGVTHLVFSPGGYMALLFMQNAESQQYRPKYVINTDMAPGVLFELAAPKAQLKGSMGIGWRPAWDVTDAQMPYTAQEQRCFKVMRDHGVDVQSRASPADALPECDLVWAFEAAALKAGRTLNSDTFLSGLKAVGTGWQSVLSFRSDFSKARQDGAFAYRILAFDDGCTCFAYRGDVQPDAA